MQGFIRWLPFVLAALAALSTHGSSAAPTPPNTAMVLAALVPTHAQPIITQTLVAIIFGSRGEPGQRQEAADKRGDAD